MIGKVSQYLRQFEMHAQRYAQIHVTKQNTSPHLLTTISLKTSPPRLIASIHRIWGNPIFSGKILYFPISPALLSDQHYGKMANVEYLCDVRYLCVSELAFIRTYLLITVSLRKYFWANPRFLTQYFTRKVMFSRLINGIRHVVETKKFKDVCQYLLQKKSLFDFEAHFNRS